MQAGNLEHAVVIQPAEQSVSFGEEKPAVSGSSEDAYSQNRRVEIRYR